MPDDHDPWNEEQLLRDAKAKAERLIADLTAQLDDLERFPGQISLAPEKLAQGRQAFANAIRSARDTLENIDHALNLARASSGRPA
jgi:ABC-type transporter Mla subunit MlaD